MNDKIMKMLTNIDYWLSYYYILKTFLILPYGKWSRREPESLSVDYCDNSGGDEGGLD